MWGSLSSWLEQDDVDKFELYYKINLWMSFIGGALTILLGVYALIKTIQGKRYLSILSIVCLFLLDSISLLTVAICEYLQFNDDVSWSDKPL